MDFFDMFRVGSMASVVLTEVIFRGALLGMIGLLSMLAKPIQRVYIWDEIDRRIPVLDELVPAWYAFIIILVTTIIMCIIIGCVSQCQLRADAKARGIRWRRRFSLQMARFALSLVGAGVLTFAFTEPLKFIVSRPRPHFLARCYGGVEHIPLMVDIPLKLTNEYCLEQITLVSETKDPSSYSEFGLNAVDNPEKFTETQLNEDRKSFPSQHAAFTSTAFLWFGLALIYSSKSIASLGHVALISGIFTILCLPALAVASSRILDYWHWALDVMVGLLIGSVIGLWQFLSYFPMELFRSSQFYDDRVYPMTWSDVKEDGEKEVYDTFSPKQNEAASIGPNYIEDPGDPISPTIASAQRMPSLFFR